jgi:hypothetical protein
MQIEKARKVGFGISIGAFTVAFANIVMYGGNPNGIFTFLYIGTALALVGSIFMIAVFSVSEEQRQKVLHHHIIAFIGLVIIDVVFAIPSFQWV